MHPNRPVVCPGCSHMFQCRKWHIKYLMCLAMYKICGDGPVSCPVHRTDVSSGGRGRSVFLARNQCGSVRPLLHPGPTRTVSPSESCSPAAAAARPICTCSTVACGITNLYLPAGKSGQLCRGTASALLLSSGSLLLAPTLPPGRENLYGNLTPGTYFPTHPFRVCTT